ncbi:DUF1330 domain-containing protein [Streptomyces sp. NBC_00267]|uniref:DUF1330 domain-containing protein n=1 Tax=unclassified Streptomyces TaxID=2593676 RepID=UPI003FA6D2E7
MLRERVTNPAEPALCAVSARAARAGHDVTPLVGYGAIETLQGAPFDGVLIHRFPSVAHARAWYESPAYQAALPPPPGRCGLPRAHRRRSRRHPGPLRRRGVRLHRTAAQTDTVRAAGTTPVSGDLIADANSPPGRP